MLLINYSGDKEFYSVAAGFLLVPVLLSGAVGYGVAAYYTQPHDYTPNPTAFERFRDWPIPMPEAGSMVLTLKGGEALTARVLRSGDKGLLVYEPILDKLKFLRWDDVLEIESLR
jgi:hypothetical protein